MRLLSLILLMLSLLCVPSLVARAADTPSASLPTLTPQPNTNAAGDGPATKEQANKYYDDCVTDRTHLSGLNPIQRGYLCSCVSTGIEATMSKNEMDALADLTPVPNRNAMAKFLENVYVPCTMPIIEENTSKDCAQRIAGSAYKSTQLSSCACLSGTMKSFLYTKGVPDMIKQMKATGKMDKQPYDTLVNSGQYQQKMVLTYQSCFDGNVP